MLEANIVKLPVMDTFKDGTSDFLNSWLRSWQYEHDLLEINVVYATYNYLHFEASSSIK